MNCIIFILILVLIIIDIYDIYHYFNYYNDFFDVKEGFIFYAIHFKIISTIWNLQDLNIGKFFELNNFQNDLLLKVINEELKLYRI